MEKRLFTFSFFLFFATHALFAQNSPVIRAYILQYKDIAMEEMKRSGVPASITLAQGIHETSAGTSVLVRNSNNHFGIKCTSQWTGASVRHDDDAPQECFRKYDDPLQSYRDHSDFLRTRKHYASLFDLEPTDYRAWAHGLKKAGYATNPRYPQILIKLIEDYDLHDYTLIAMGQKSEGPDAVWAQQDNAPISQPQVVTAAVQPTLQQLSQPIIAVQYPSGVFRINDTRVIWVTQGTSYLSIAETYHVPLSRLFEFNDMQPQETAAVSGLLFLQRKRKKGSAASHKVAFGESLHSIAQAESIRLESLLELNHLEAGMQPEVGESLYLQEKAPAMPRLLDATAKVNLSQLTSLQASGETGSFTEYVVQPKETLYAISRRYGVSVQDIMKWNELQDNSLKTGQSLRIKK